MMEVGNQSKRALAEAMPPTGVLQSADLQVVHDADRSGRGLPDWPSLSSGAVRSLPAKQSDVSEANQSREALPADKPAIARPPVQPSESGWPSTSKGYEVTLEPATAKFEGSVGIVAPVLVTQLGVPVVPAAVPSANLARVTEQITRLLVQEVREGQRVVTVEVQGLQGVRVSVREERGEWLVSFACATDGPRHMLNDRATSMAAELAARLAHPVRVRVLSDDPLEPAVREAAADWGRRTGGSGRDERRADAGSSAHR